MSGVEMAASQPVGATAPAVAAATGTDSHHGHHHHHHSYVPKIVDPLLDTHFFHRFNHKRTIFGFNPFSVFTLLFMIMLIVLYGTCVEFTPNQSEINTNTLTSSAAISVLMLQETTVMMIIGFGFLYTLMRRYAWSGISFALFIAGLCGLWGALCNGFWGQVYVKYNSTAGVIPGALQKIPYSFSLAVVGQYSAATVLISWGCVIGRVSAMQILFMMVWEVIFSSISNWICGSLLMVTDPGGSMSIHTFGAAFGLAVAYVLGDKAKKAGKGPSTSRHNGTFAFLGTAFLLTFWPSFNAALQNGQAQYAAFLNTATALFSSIGGAFAFTKAINSKFTDYDIQNGVLAGGVAIGAACNMLINPWGAMLTGLISAALTVYCFNWLTQAINRLGVTDTCGVANLHLLNGFIGAIASSIAMGSMTLGTGSGQYPPALATSTFPGLAAGRSNLQQGGFQMAAFCIALAIGVVSGAIAGAVMKLQLCEPKTKNDSFYEDAAEWNVPTEEQENVELLEKIHQQIHQRYGPALAAAAKLIESGNAPAAAGATPTASSTTASATVDDHAVLLSVAAVAEGSGSGPAPANKAKAV